MELFHRGVEKLLFGSNLQTFYSQPRMLILAVLAVIIAGTKALPSMRWCSEEDKCNSCTIRAALGAKCTINGDRKFKFQFCNPRTKRIDVEASSYLTCTDGIYKQKFCSDGSLTHFSRSTLNCIDPASLNFQIQGTSGSGRVGDVCSFNTDCLSGMYCANGQCRCLSTYIAVDVYCYERISPSESGCFYDIQCSAVWPDAYCKNGQCKCPSDDMIAVTTKDGTFCLWTGSTEPSCPLPSLPPPNSASTLVVLPGPSAGNIISIATCNPHASSLPSNEESLLTQAHEHKCAVRGTADDPNPKDVSDLYDCIDNSKFWSNQGLDTSAHPIGVCCMNRAFTCQQPKKGEADELGAVPRWWFNSVVGSCQQFLFDPSSVDVSPNNFETLNHCESFCKDTCLRGNPAYVPVRSAVGRVPQADCTTSRPCPDSFECVDVASQSLCCPSREIICSESGGRVRNPGRTTPFDAGMSFLQLTGVPADYVVDGSTRYYYNSVDGQCHAFTYSGFLGNFNNFHTQTDCEMFCARLQCTHGSPLSIGLGAPQRCSRAGDCPSTHTCKLERGVCCPTPQTLCSEPVRVGDCEQSIRQFWYNAETRSCESFFYTGCHGNNNRFSSLNECQSFCKGIGAEPKCPQGRAYVEQSGKFRRCGDGHGSNACPINYECHFDGFIHGCCPSKGKKSAFTCSLHLDSGTACGSGSGYRYYFNNQLKECQSFLFLGCDGNSNNFPSAAKCESYCEISVCPNGGSPLSAGSRMRSCSTADPCPNGYECSHLETNGLNHRRCCPTKAYICSKPPQMGMFSKCASLSSQTRYYFNVALRNCSPYSSNGCDTSLNSFRSRSECDDFCFSASCNPGDVVYKDPNTNRPFLCNVALQNSCPVNYQCTLNAPTQNHVCCGSDSMGVCPAGEKAFMNPITSSPRQCTMAVDGGCPSGYLCRFSLKNHKYYCCGSITGKLCRSGRALYRHAATQLPQQCQMDHGRSGCPPSFSCQSDVPGAFHGYCCSRHPICPDKAEFHIDAKTQMPTTCSSEGYASCPQGFICQKQLQTVNHFCCATKDNEIVIDGCPPGHIAYNVNDELKSCDPFNVSDSTCPHDYSCQWSLANQKYQCCGTRPIRLSKPSQIDDGCPRNQFALLDRQTKKPRLCTAGEENSCPTGFFCQFSSKKSQFQCCGQSGGCPTGRAAYVAVDGNPQECVHGPDMCADGYECVTSIYKNGKNICCSKEDNECARNEKIVAGRCVVQAKVGDACQNDEECTGGSKCRANICVCSEKQHMVNGVCVEEVCKSDQIVLEGHCVNLTAIGEPCKSSLQCVSNSRCVTGRCSCGRNEKFHIDKCVKITREWEKARRQELPEVCPLSTEHTFFEANSTRLRYCRIDRDCPDKYTCQYSELMKQNICCGKDEMNKKKQTPESRRGSEPPNSGHCPPAMTPYVLNGQAKSCASSTCPYGFQCTFSWKMKNYFCCTKMHKNSNLLQRDDGCESGTALLYPSTQQPVQCDLKKRNCPNGYFCLPNTTTKALQCCTIPLYRDSAMSTDREMECPNYMVRVTTNKKGRKSSYCARSCPASQSARDHVCQ